ncbi:MAG: SUMF1/EgtB/PvdO family nonheme iron enzyme [bacterium]
MKIFLSAIIAIILIYSCSNSPTDPDNSVWKPLDMVKIPSAAFNMKILSHSTGLETLAVRITHDFLIDKTEITIGHFRLFEKSAGINITSFYEAYYDTAWLPTDALKKKRDQADIHPAENIPWFLAARFCNWRSREEKLAPCYDTTTWICSPENNGYRLPTLAEWQYISDSLITGTTSNIILPLKTNELSDTAGSRPDITSSGDTIMNFYGNVMEWCNEWYHTDLDSFYPDTVLLDPMGPKKGVLKIYFFTRDSVGAAYPDRQFTNIGFRCVRKAE